MYLRKYVLMNMIQHVTPKTHKLVLRYYIAGNVSETCLLQIELSANTLRLIAAKTEN